MIMNHRYGLAAAALVIAFSSCDFLGADERTGGSYLYVGDSGYDQLFVVDVATNEVVRTLSGFEAGLGGVWTHVATKSGRKLYVDTRGGTYSAPGKLHVVDVRTWRRRVILDEAAEPYVSPTGDVLVFTRDAGRSEQAIGRVDTLSDEIVFFDSLDVRQNSNRLAVAFDPRRPILYSVNSAGRLFAYDYDRESITRTYMYGGNPRRMVVSPDGSRLYVAGGSVLDLEKDSLLARLGGNGRGSLALSPSGDALYHTDPGEYLSRLLGPPSGEVSMYDTRSWARIGTVDVTEASSFYGSGNNITDSIVLSMDGNTAYVSNWGDLVFVIDVKAGRVTALIHPDERGVNTSPLTLAPIP
jgi:YVTN family beta-propeller protein